LDRQKGQYWRQQAVDQNFWQQVKLINELIRLLPLKRR
jgi:hypothetical protein